MSKENRLPNLDVETARAFFAVVKTKNFGDASELVHKTPAALSYRIRMLEEKLGCQLFNRTSHALELTPAGEIFFVKLKQVFFLLEQIPEELEIVSRGCASEYRIGVSTHIDEFRLYPLLELLQKKFPRTSFLLHSVEPVLSFQQLQASNDHFLVTSLNSVTWPEKYSHSCYGHIEWTLLYPKTDDLLENSLPIWTLCSITPSLFQELSFPGNRPLQVIQVQSYQSLYQACQQEQPFMAIVPTRLRTQFSNQRLQVKRLSKKVSSDLELSLIWLNNHDYEIATYISDYFKSHLSELGVIGTPLTTK